MSQGWLNPGVLDPPDSKVKYVLPSMKLSSVSPPGPKRMNRKSLPATGVSCVSVSANDTIGSSGLVRVGNVAALDDADRVPRVTGWTVFVMAKLLLIPVNVRVTASAPVPSVTVFPDATHAGSLRQPNTPDVVAVAFQTKGSADASAAVTRRRVTNRHSEGGFFMHRALANCAPAPGGL